MANKSPTKQGKAPRSRPVSFRIDGDLLDRLDEAAETIGAPRNKLVCAVLREYLIERGIKEAERIAAKHGVQNGFANSIFG